jgi:hypothetical protein
VAKESLELTEWKIRNLLQIVEDGYEGGGSVRQRLVELEQKKDDLQRLLQIHETGDEPGKIKDTARLVKQFVEGFEEEFNRVSQEERKVMIQKCIADIVIDREASVARFRVNRIPALTPEIRRALNFVGNEGSCVSCQSARNRTVRLTRKERSFARGS